MKVRQTNMIGVPVVQVVLSERNLRSLLAKLSIPGSQCSIYREGVMVTSEVDEVHYQDHEAGPMHPLTEEALLEMGDG